MKIQFDSNLDYQDRVISSIVDIFEDQEVCQSDNLEYLYYNAFNSTSQASLQCSPREVVL